MTLTTLKEEARADLENERFGWMEFDKASGSRYLNTDKVEAFLDSIIDRTYHATKEEVRGEVRKIKTWVFTAPYGLEMEDGVVIPRKRTDDEYVKVSELRAALDDTTTSPSN